MLRSHPSIPKTNRRHTFLKTKRRRRGNILIVTLLLLALFATVGLTIVYYTKDLAEQQRINIEAASNGALTFSDDGSMAFNAFLAQLIYDSPTASITSQNPSNITGYSLLRSMYGGVDTSGSYPATATIPWNGVGSFQETITAGVARPQIVNYAQYYLASGKTQLITPEISATTGAFVPQNAPYTYPDLKDLYLASIVPATGQVLVPSFHRKTAGFGALAPTNANWTNAIGRALTPRPRPQDHLVPGMPFSAFPYPPPNADGSFTGDVQNLTGSYVYNATTGQYIAHNDSIWIDIGLPPITLLNGKTVKPLVAPLIIDLDSLLNINVAGNVYSSFNSSTLASSGSGTGIGPWEINLARALPTDGLSLINGRPTPQAYANLSTPNTLLSTRAYNKYLSQTGAGQLPTYSAVCWNTGAGAAPANLNLPGPTGLSYYATSPLYSPTATSPLMSGYDSTNSTINNPAVLFNPTEWPLTSSSTSQPYSPADLQYLLAQYCAPPASYIAPLGTYSTVNPPSLGLNGLSPLTSVRGTPSSYTAPAQPQSATQSNYRLDPANNSRGIVTPYSWAIDSPGLSPNFNNLSIANALALNPGTILTGGILSSTAQVFPTPGSATGTISDFGVQFSKSTGQLTSTPTQWTNGRAALGPIDLNRPLADYRGNVSQPLGPTNMIGLTPYNVAPYNTAPYMGTLGTQTLPQAIIDRQQFAMSIFVRLVVASGAYGSFQVLPGVGESIYFPAGAPVAGTPAFNALQALAQLAANIVDYIDQDDVSTAFVWNPVNPADPLNPTNLSSLAAMNNAMVFGVEKPRLLLNEAFAGVSNNPNDTAMNNATPPKAGSPTAGTGQNGNPYVRYWFELVNPTPTTTNVPIGTGAVTVRYTAGATGNTPGLTASYSPYLVQIARSNNYTGANGTSGLTGISGLLRDPSNPANQGNVTGGLGGAYPDIVWDFSAGDATPTLYTVNPANSQPNTAGSTLVCAPAPTYPTPTGTQQSTVLAPDWNPNGGALTWTTTFPTANVITGAPLPAAPPSVPMTTSLTFESLNGNTTNTNVSLTLANTMNNNGQVLPTSGLNQNVFLLQRLANPYQPPNDPVINPILNSNNPSIPAYNPALPPNPYITVDYMDFVPATDQILMLSGQMTKRTMGATESPTTYPGGQQGKPALLASLGKVQPYCSWTAINQTTPSATTGTYPFTFPTSLVVPQAQSSTPILNTNAYMPGVVNTFGYINSVNPTTGPVANPTYQPGGGTALFAGTETLMTPFNWFPHMDRQLMNQTELFQVSMGKPHEYTLRSIVPNALAGATDVTPYGYMAINSMAINPSAASPTTLYRALDVLRIQPYGHMTALGGRLPGRLNINTIQDKRVWDALFDASSWNGFTQNDVSTMWKLMILGSRTPTSSQKYTISGSALTDTAITAYSTPHPGQSVYDLGASTTADRPFLPFGAPAYSGGTFAYPSGSGAQDTLARGGSIYTASNMGTNPHPYQQPEALRKILNNTTTVSHTFAVWVTVGYFEYNLNGPNVPGILGAEYYNQVPGDLRRKYFGVVDRSMIGLDPSTNTQSSYLPFFTTLNGTAVSPAGSTTIPVTTSVMGTGSIYSNSNLTPTNITSGTGYLAIGTGATQEIVKVSTTLPTTQTTTGATVITISALQYPHWPGESVSNVIPGWAANGNPNGLGAGGVAWPGGPAFNYSQAPFSYIVPFTVRLQ